MKTRNSPPRLFYFIVLFVFTGPAKGQFIVDQFADAFNAPSPSGELGGPIISEFDTVVQTFTVGIGGLLTSVEVQVQQGDVPDVPTDDLVMTIRPTTAGVPDFSQSFGSVSLPATTIPPFDNFTSGPFTSFDVSGLNIMVSPGQVLAIDLSYPTGTGSYFIYDAEVPIYAGGSTFVLGVADGFFADTGRDSGFRTTVLIPEPSSLLMLGFGALVLFRRRRGDMV
ncbi:MAG: PEP-CTERM sorting domain-containing protein [Verrucomicrobiota bacterium]